MMFVARRCYHLIAVILMAILCFDLADLTLKTQSLIRSPHRFTTPTPPKLQNLPGPGHTLPAVHSACSRPGNLPHTSGATQRSHPPPSRSIRRSRHTGIPPSSPSIFSRFRNNSRLGSPIREFRRAFYQREEIDHRYVPDWEGPVLVPNQIHRPSQNWNFRCIYTMFQF
jgi:hypothetical protein